jgi:hypothetical protein
LFLYQVVLLRRVKKKKELTSCRVDVTPSDYALRFLVCFRVSAWQIVNVVEHDSVVG